MNWRSIRLGVLKYFFDFKKADMIGSSVIVLDFLIGAGEFQ